MATSFLGQIRLMAAPIVPEGWAICNGQLLPISQNKALFSLLGTKYGGDGLVNFALPNLTNRVPVGVNHNDIKMGTVSAGNNAKLSPNAGYYILGTAIVGSHYIIALQGVFPSAD